MSNSKATNNLNKPASKVTNPSSTNNLKESKVTNASHPKPNSKKDLGTSAGLVNLSEIAKKIKK